MTNATSDTTLSVEMLGEGKILVNGGACNKNEGISLKKGDTVLVKASHSMHFENIVDVLKDNFN